MNARSRLSPAELRQGLDAFTGSLQVYRYPFGGLLYTEGAEFFAREGGRNGAFWFLDIVATEFVRKLKEHPFLVILLSCKDSKAVITVSDGDDHAVVVKPIDYTDLQEGDWKFYLTDNTLLLPGEH